MELVSYQFKAMGGPCELSLWLESRDGLPASIFNRMEQEVRRLEQKYSRFLPDSLLSRLNRQELNGQSLDDETSGLLNFAEQCYQASDGLFDLTIGTLHRVWNFQANELPQPERLQESLDCVGWKKLGWDGVSLAVPEHMSVDLGGLVKEFAVDRLMLILKEQKVSGLINLAGDIGVSDSQPSGQPWKVAITHPRAPGVIADIELYEGALASSGDYERFMVVSGKRYCHLLRPDTGFPPDEGNCSVSVLADQCLLAGSISTIAMLKGSEGRAWLDTLGLPFLAIDQNLNASGTVKV